MDVILRLKLVFGLTALSCIVGMLIGLFAGSISGIYRPSTGVALGAGQGASLGLLAGVLLVALQLWHVRRLAQPELPVNRFVKGVVIFLLVLTTLFTPMLGAGWIWYQHEMARPLQLAKRWEVDATGIVQQQGRFRQVRVEFDSRGVHVGGEVPTASDYVDLVTLIESLDPPTGLVLEVELTAVGLENTNETGS
ncbi:MAG: hypothetical protein AAF743_04530 [Planctomycetota bacterium]